MVEKSPEHTLQEAEQLLSNFAGREDLSDEQRDQLRQVAEEAGAATSAERQIRLETVRIRSEKEKELQATNEKAGFYRASVLQSLKLDGIKKAAEKAGFSNPDFVTQLVHARAEANGKGEVTIKQTNGSTVSIDDFVAGLAKQSRFKHALKKVEPPPAPFVPKSLQDAMPKDWSNKQQLETFMRAVQAQKR